jgi:hypothetical protein
VIRLAAAYAVMTAIVISRTVDSIGEALIFLGAVAVALEALRRVVGKPAMKLYRKADNAFDELTKFPAWRDKVDGRLDGIERQTGADLTVKHEIHHDHHDSP